MRRMGSCVVMMELPSYRCPQIQSFAPHSITKATKDLLVVLLCDGLALRGILMMYHTTGVKENGQYDFDFAVDQLWFFLVSGMTNVATVMTASWFLGRTYTPMFHHLWSRCSESWGHCWHCPACPVWCPDAIASTPLLAASV